MADETRLTAGLCASCAHVQVVPSSRASEFYLCRRSLNDRRFPRYPMLPVLTCEGYEAADVPKSRVNLVVQSRKHR
jgi:hypothetical protein